MPRVLVIEDYPPLAKVLAIALRRAGFEAVRVGSLTRARHVEGIFDAAIADIDLPDGSGVEVVRDLRSSGRVGVVVFYTANQDDADREAALAIGPIIEKDRPADEVVDVVIDELEVREDLARAVGAPDPVRPTQRSGTRRRIR
ncbi:MAG: response regulator [Myxococcales bacterium]|nr:response regulator [Myxococcales bacterium]MCB9576829.1 response regulator [Polyangiaceae bacterium]